MEHLATIVFERTPAGAVAIKMAGDASPRQLRTLLLPIDGRSPVSQYVPFLTALAPLSEKFAELEGSGLARRRAVAVHDAAGRADRPAPQGTPLTQVSEDELRNFASQQFSVTSAPLATPDADDFAAQLRALALHDGSMDTSSRPAALAAPNPRSALQRPLLANLLAKMQAYLSQAIGLKGLPVALMLEQITSLDQLRQELPSYQALLASYGASPAAHTQSLTQQLDQVI